MQSTKSELARKVYALKSHVVDNINEAPFFFREFPHLISEFECLFRGIYANPEMYSLFNLYNVGLSFTTDYEVAEKFAYDNSDGSPFLCPILFRAYDTLGIQIDHILEELFQEVDCAIDDYNAHGDPDYKRILANLNLCRTLIEDEYEVIVYRERKKVLSVDYDSEETIEGWAMIDIADEHLSCD